MDREEEPINMEAARRLREIARRSGGAFPTMTLPASKEIIELAIEARLVAPSEPGEGRADPTGLKIFVKDANSPMPPNGLAGSLICVMQTTT